MHEIIQTTVGFSSETESSSVFHSFCFRISMFWWYNRGFEYHILHRGKRLVCITASLRGPKGPPTTMSSCPNCVVRWTLVHTRPFTPQESYVLIYHCFRNLQRKRDHKQDVNYEGTVHTSPSRDHDPTRTHLYFILSSLLESWRR